MRLKTKRRSVPHDERLDLVWSVEAAIRQTAVVAAFTEALVRKR